MAKSARKVAFVTAATDHGTFIVNRFDQHQWPSGVKFGVGFNLLDSGRYEPDEVNLVLELLDLRREYHGDGVFAVDCGANIGVHTIEWAKHMDGWGALLAIEAQERLYYALAGNIAINNCFNARAIHAAVAAYPGVMKMPVPDYSVPGSFGSLELRERETTEFIGQDIDYSESKMVDVRTVSLDSLGLGRIDLIKLDIEAMELEALDGGARCIRDQRPILLVEKLKIDKSQLVAWLAKLGYSMFGRGVNLLAIHQSDRCLANVAIADRLHLASLKLPHA